MTLSKRSSRDIKKRLYDFARKEYETKSPEYVEVRKAKGTKTFYRGPVPQLILTKYKAIAYTVFADYGTLCRLYYFNRDGFCIRDTSYSERDLIKIKNHLSKTSTKVLRYPKVEPKPTISNLSVKLDNKYAKMLADIEKITKVKITSRPIITLGSETEISPNFTNIFSRKGKFLEAPVNAENHSQINSILAYEAFQYVFHEMLNNEKLSQTLAPLGVLLYLSDIESVEFITSTINSIDWNKEHFYKDSRDKRREMISLFEYVKSIKEFIIQLELITNPVAFLELKADNLLKGFLAYLFSKIESKHRLVIFLQNEAVIASDNNELEEAANYLLLSSFLEIKSKEIGKITPKTLELSKHVSTSEPRGIIVYNLIIAMNTLHLSLLIKNWRSNHNLFPSKLELRFDEIVDLLFEKAIRINVEFSTRIFDKPGDIIIKIKNISDSIFGTFVTEDLHWTPRNSLELIGDKRKIRVKSLAPDMEATLIQPIIPKKEGTINFSNLGLRFNDPFGIKHYIKLTIPSLRIGRDL